MHVRSNTPLTPNMLTNSTTSCCKQIIVKSLLILLRTLCSVLSRFRFLHMFEQNKWLHLIIPRWIQISSDDEIRPTSCRQIIMQVIRHTICLSQQDTTLVQGWGKPSNQLCSISRVSSLQKICSLDVEVMSETSRSVSDMVKDRQTIYRSDSDSTERSRDVSAKLLTYIAEQIPHILKYNTLQRTWALRLHQRLTIQLSEADRSSWYRYSYYYTLCVRYCLKHSSHIRSNKT